MLSLIKYPGAIPIAQLEGGKLHGQKLYIVTNEYEGSKGVGKKEFSHTDKSAKIRQIPIKKKNNREILYIAGPSGAGKSTYVNDFVGKYKKKNPKSDIYLFSRVENDESLDKLNPIRIKINEELIDDPVNILEEVNDGDLVIFDDTDTISDKSLLKAVNQIKHDILETGRHKNICCVITSHLINGNDKKDMRTIFNEAHTITIFPNSGNKHGMNYMLNNYLGIPKKRADELLKTKSRYLTFSTTAPNYVLSEDKVELL